VWAARRDQQELRAVHTMVVIIDGCLEEDRHTFFSAICFSDNGRICAGGAELSAFLRRISIPWIHRRDKTDNVVFPACTRDIRRWGSEPSSVGGFATLLSSADMSLLVDDRRAVRCSAVSRTCKEAWLDIERRWRWTNRRMRCYWVLIALRWE
jgi:hypothetical protein